MNSENKNGFNQIKVSDKLDDVINSTILKASQDKSKKRFRVNFLKVNAAIVSLFVIFIVSINISPAFAESLNGVPIISSMSKALLFHYDKNIVNADKQAVKETKIDKDISVTIDNVVADDKDLFILYTLNGELDKNNLKNLLLKDFVLKDASNNVLVDGKDFSFATLPPELAGKTGDFIILCGSGEKRYKCYVSSLGNSLDGYSKDKKTYGSIELISLDASSKIPAGVKLEVSSLVEAYNTTVSDGVNLELFSKTGAYNATLQNSSNIISKFNRKSVEIKGKWDFDFKIENNLKVVKPEEFSNIKFSTNNTDFTVESLKIYPTHIDSRIKLGENKLDKAQCNSIGDIRSGSRSILPYLIDESGNKYLVTGTALAPLDKDKCIQLSFESSYFNKNKELYLVISQLSYTPGAPFMNIDPIKVKVK